MLTQIVLGAENFLRLWVSDLSESLSSVFPVRVMEATKGRARKKERQYVEENVLEVGPRPLYTIILLSGKS